MDEWVEQATCRSVDPELWFPDNPRQSYHAIALCVQCPVQRQCLKLSLDTKAEFGVWGGLGSTHRIKVQRTYTTRSKADRERMIDRLLNEIDEDIEAILEEQAIEEVA